MSEPWAWILVGVALLVLLGALFYWQLIVAEGTYLGSRVVAWTYDLVAGRYDGIKQFNAQYESWFVAGPLVRSLQAVEQPLVLDVATGTGRLPLALLREGLGIGRGSRRGGCRIVGLDLSRGMLRRARQKLQAYGDGVCLIRQNATDLPFADGTFDAVTSLEALEFMPRPLEVLAEMVRVLAPGGVLLLTNRVGGEARLLPGRALSRSQFKAALAAQPLRQIEVRRWQASYDLALAHKEGPARSGGSGGVDPWALIRCPACGGTLSRQEARLSCPSCGRTYEICDGIVDLVG